jgi:hypothetical protein
VEGSSHGICSVGIMKYITVYLSICTFGRQHCGNKNHWSLKVNVTRVLIRFENTNSLTGIWSQHRRDSLWCIWGWALSRGTGAAAWTFRSSRNSGTSFTIPWDRAPCEIQVGNKILFITSHMWRSAVNIFLRN